MLMRCCSIRHRQNVLLPIWNNNSYTNFGTGTTTPFGYMPTASNYDFAGWKAIRGFDANSTYSSAARTGDDVFAVPNEYEVGRASIVAYNWDSSPTVSVDLPAIGLSNEQRYEIHNAFDYDHPPIIGVYNSGAPIISLNVSQAQWGTVAASPIGSGVSIPGTWPRYFVGLVKSVPGATTAKNADFDGDGRTDLSVFRPSDGNWYVSRSSDSGYQVTAWGLSTDILTPGDYDGDGKTDHAVFRPSDGVWWILQSSTNTWATLRFGQRGDIPVPGDYDGDGKTDRASWREGTWWISQSTNQKAFIVTFGKNGDIPLVGDFDGDRKADFAFFRGSTNSTWNILRSTDGTVIKQFGAFDDKLVPADFDGDGTTDFGVWRPSTGLWYTAPSSEPNPAQNFTAASGDKPVPNAYVPQMK